MENTHKPTASKAVLFGIIGGIVGSIAMIGPKIISNIQLEMPYNVNWIVFGIIFGIIVIATTIWFGLLPAVGAGIAGLNIAPEIPA